MTRGTLPRRTITGVRERPDKGLDLLVDGTDPIGYLKFNEILASTPHELRQMARRLEAEGARALVLDLRSLGQCGPPPDGPPGRLPARWRHDRAGPDGRSGDDLPGRARCPVPGMAAGSARRSKHLGRGGVARRRPPGQRAGRARRLADLRRRRRRADDRARRRWLLVDPPDDRAAPSEATGDRSDSSPSSFGIMPRQPSPRSSEATKAANLTKLVRELDRIPLAELRVGSPREPEPIPLAELRVGSRRLVPRMGPPVGVMPDRAATGPEMDEALKSAQQAYREGPSDETRRRLQELIMKLRRSDGRGCGPRGGRDAAPLER